MASGDFDMMQVFEEENGSMNTVIQKYLRIAFHPQVQHGFQSEHSPFPFWRVL